MNRATICGNLGRDPELRNTKSGMPVANFSIATSIKRKDGDKQVEETEWHNIVAWGKTAENCAKYLRKGSKALVEGSLKTRKWEKNGVKHYTTEIHTNDVEFVSSAAANETVSDEQDMALKRQALDEGLDQHLAAAADACLDDIPF